MNHHSLEEISTPRRVRTRELQAPRVVLTASDHHELSLALAAVQKLGARRPGELRALQDKLGRAAIVHAPDLPEDAITMNSCAELIDLTTNERLKLTLVYPVDANLEAGRISVLDPLGTAMLGHRVGDRFEWNVPYAVRRLKVTAVRFQPEAALALAA